MILDIQNVSCRYTSREKDTLTGVNLHIEEGEMVLIAGRSGCGKSTLVKAVTGLLDKEVLQVQRSQEHRCQKRTDHNHAQQYANGNSLLLQISFQVAPNAA